MRRMTAACLGALVASAMACPSPPPTGTDGSTGGGFGGGTGGLAFATLTFQRDDARAKEKAITSTGGSLSVTDATGTTWTLVVPSQTSFPSRTLRLVPLTQLGGGSVTGGVLFEPDGLVFPRPATLTITTSGSPPMVYGFAHDGSNVWFADATTAEGTTTVAMPHFSGVGIGPGATNEDLCAFAQLKYQDALREAKAIELQDLSVPEPPRWPMECVEMTNVDRHTVDDFVRAFQNPEAEVIGKLVSADRRRGVCNIEQTWPADTAGLCQRLSRKLDALSKVAEKADLYVPIAVATISTENQLALLNSIWANQEERKASLANRAVAAREEYLKKLRTEHAYDFNIAIVQLDRDASIFYGRGNYEETQAALKAALTFKLEIDAAITVDQPTYIDDTGSEFQGQQISISQQGSHTFNPIDRYSPVWEIPLTYQSGTHDWLKLTGSSEHTHCTLMGHPSATTPFGINLDVCDRTKPYLDLSFLGTNSTAHLEQWHCEYLDDQHPENTTTVDRPDTVMFDSAPRIFRQYANPSGGLLFHPQVVDGEVCVDAFFPGQSSAPFTGSGHVGIKVTHTPQ